MSVEIYIFNKLTVDYKKLMNELLNWLTLNQLEKYADILQQNDITSVDLLIELSEDDIKELGFL